MKKIYLSIAFAFALSASFAQTYTLNWDTAAVTNTAVSFPLTYGLGSASAVITTGDATWSSIINSPSAVNTYPTHAYGNGYVLGFMHSGNSTGSFSITFDKEVTNVTFSLFDIDGNQVQTLSAADGSSNPVAITGQALAALEGYTGATVVVGGSGTTSMTLTGPNGGYNPGGTPGPTSLAAASRTGANIQIAGPVKVINFNVALNTNGDPGFYISDITATIPSVVPVILSSFDARAAKQDAQLTWTTETEQGNAGFEIQRSIPGGTWATIGTQAGKGAAGNSSVALSYSFTDTKTFSGTNLYRIMQKDLDGHISYSDVRKLSFKKDMVTAFPNPTADRITINNDLTNVKEILVTDLAGKAVLRAGTRSNIVDLSSLASGMYFVQVVSNDGSVSSAKVVKK